MLKANFTITESGGTGVVQLQSSADSGATWQDIGQKLTLSAGALTVDDSTKLYIDTSVLIQGQSYHFRIADTSGTPVSDAVTYTIPTAAPSETLAISTFTPSTDHTSFVLSGDVTGGSGSYSLQAKGNNLGTAWVVISAFSGVTSGALDCPSVAIDDTTEFHHGNGYTFQLVDTVTGVTSATSDQEMPQSSVIPTVILDSLTKVDTTNTKLSFHVYNNVAGQQLKLENTTNGDEINVYGNLPDGGLSYTDLPLAYPLIPGVVYLLTIRSSDGTFIAKSNTITIPLPFITGYTSVKGLIDFTNTGGDNWDAQFHITPASAASVTGASILNYDRDITFYTGGTALPTDNATTLTADETVSVSHGAGVYALDQRLRFTDGSGSRIFRLVKVDAAGNILGDIQYNGLTVNSASGLDISVSASLTQSGVSELPTIAVVNTAETVVTDLASGLNYTGAIPVDTGSVFLYTSLDTTFWSDLPSYIFSSHGIFSCGSVLTIS